MEDQKKQNKAKSEPLVVRMGKVIVLLSLVIVVLISCILILSSIFVGAWMHTYNAFTSRQKIAEIEVRDIGSIDGYDKFELVYTQIEGESALAKFIFPNRENVEVLEPQIYTMYGDSFWLEVHTAKLPDFLTLANFKAMYKVTGVGADFIEDKEKSNSLPIENRSAYDLNGGVDPTWKWLKRNEDKLSFIIDTAFFSREGDSIYSNEKVWDVYITEEGILLDSSN